MMIGRSLTHFIIFLLQKKKPCGTFKSCLNQLACCEEIVAGLQTSATYWPWMMNEKSMTADEHWNIG